MTYDDKSRTWLVDEIARLRWMLTADVDERLISELGAMAEEQAGLRNLDPQYSIEVAINQQELASRIGACRETVNRKLQIMRREGLVSITRYMWIVVTPKLMKLARLEMENRK